MPAKASRSREWMFRLVLMGIHRLSTIRSSDQILVLEGGVIVERGKHEELLAAAGRYRQLYDKQYRFETDRFINPGEDFTPEPPKTPPPRPIGNAL